jgi:hypothetical protein
MKTLSILFQWLVVIAVIVALYWAAKLATQCNWTYLTAQLGTMPGYLVVLTALAFSFTWVKVWRFFPMHKPFKCLKCMTGWTALALAFTFNTPFWFVYVFIGLFTGAVVDNLLTKYL